MIPDIANVELMYTIRSATGLYSLIY